MTTRELETDGVPAPSDIELAAMDARPCGLDFDGATRALAICRDRERFHRWCGRNVDLSKVRPLPTWRVLYRAFVRYEINMDHIQKGATCADARDLDDTQQDALR